MFGSGKHSIPPNYIKVYRKAIIRSNVQSDRLNKKISSFFIVFVFRLILMIFFDFYINIIKLATISKIVYVLSLYKKVM